MGRYRYLLLFCILMDFGASGQISSEGKSDFVKHHGLLSGLHISKYPTVEIGYARLFYSPDDEKMPITAVYAFSVENYFGADYMMAPKIAVWANIIGINYGVSIPWYTDLKGESSLRIRSEIGFGYRSYKAGFAYNPALTNRFMPHIPKVMLSLNYILDF